MEGVLSPLIMGKPEFSEVIKKGHIEYFCIDQPHPGIC
jgi:hypothetical protein